MAHRATWGRTKVSEEEKRSERGEHGPEPLLGFLREGLDETGYVHQVAIRLASLNNLVCFRL